MLSLFARFRKSRNTIIEQLLNDPAPRVRHALFMNPHLPDTIRRQLQDDEEATGYDPYFYIENPPDDWEFFLFDQHKQALAEDPDTPLDVLMRLTRDEDSYTAGLAVQHPAMPVDQLHDFARNPDLAIHVVSHPRCPERYLEKFSRHSDTSLRSTLAANLATPVPVLERLAGSYEFWVRAAVASNPSAPAHLLFRLMKEPHESVRKSVAENTNAPAAALAMLAEDPDFEIRSAVAENPATPLPVLMALFDAMQPVYATDSEDGEGFAEDEEPEVIWDNDHSWRLGIRQRIAAHPAIPASQLQCWGEDAESMLQSGVAANPQSPPALLLTFAKQQLHEETLRGLSQNPAATAEVLSLLADHWDSDIRVAVAMHAHTPAAVLARLAADDDEEIRQKLAEHPATPPEILDRLSTDENDRIRWLVAARADTPDAALKRLAEDGNEEIREQLARHIRPDA